jgi:ubiquinone/menaquinone biosynthesis C-methylase UbiE
VSGKDTGPAYLLGHSEAELDRLVTQSRFYGELTEEVLVRAGIGAGMRVLDLGCGAGDVSLLLASMVGPTGSVLGVDRSAEFVQFAQERAACAGFASLTFRESDLTDFRLDAPVDAIVGRFVLLFLADPASVLTRLCPFLRPGGLVVFHEMDMTTGRSFPPVPLYQRVMHWIQETFRRGGAQLDMGSRLFATFRQAGLPGPELLLRARIETPPDSPAYAYLAESVRSVLPMAERLGVTTAAEVQIDTLAGRLRDEVVKAQAVLVLPSVIGAWVRIPELSVNPANPTMNPTPPRR